MGAAKVDPAPVNGTPALVVDPSPPPVGVELLLLQPAPITARETIPATTASFLVFISYPLLVVGSRDMVPGGSSRAVAPG